MKDTPDYEAIYAAQVASVNFLRDEAKDLRVRWDKGINYLLSFFTELERMRPQITDELLNDWCFWNMGLTLPTIRQTAKLLEEQDAARVREETKVANNIAKAKAVEEREKTVAKKQEGEATTARLRKEIELELIEQITKKLEENVELTEAGLRRGETDITKELVADCKEAVIAGGEVYGNARKEMMAKHKVGPKTYDFALQQARGEIIGEARAVTQLGKEAIIPAKKKRGPRAPVITTTDIIDKMTPKSESPYVPTTPVSTDADIQALSNAELGGRFLAVYIRAEEEGRTATTAHQKWVDSTMMLAELIGEAHRRFPGSSTFGKWRNDNGLGNDLIKPHNLSALSGFARDLTAARTELEAANGTSWQTIWKEMLNRSANVSRPIPANNPEEITETATAQTVH